MHEFLLIREFTDLLKKEADEETSTDQVKTRQDILSALQSGLDHRLPLVPFHTRLSFKTKPAALSDPPASVDPSTISSRNFVKFYEWLLSTRKYLAGLEEVNDRDVDTRLAVLVCKMDEHLQRLTTLQEKSWESEKVEAGLYGTQPELENGPSVYDPGEPLRVA